MGLAARILATYRGPRAVVRRQLAEGLREERLLVLLMAACLLLFVAQWPMHARMAHLDPARPLEARLAGALTGALFYFPLLAYALAGISHAIARLFGGAGSFAGARLALFWSLLAIAPLALLNGLAAGLFGQAAIGGLSGLVVFAVFLWFWGAALWCVEFEKAEADAALPG